MDAITSLREDHRRVEKLFKQFEKLEKAGDSKGQQKVVGEIISELSVHAVIEEQVFYPTIRKEVEEVGDVVLEGLEEHHIVKWTLSELEQLDPSDERFKPKVKVLIESVRHHVEEEEGEMFPKVREAMGRKALQELGETLEVARKNAPTSPNPTAPDEPPGGVPTTEPPAPAPVQAAAKAASAAKPAPTGRGLGLLGRRKGK